MSNRRSSFGKRKKKGNIWRKQLFTFGIKLRKWGVFLRRRKGDNGKDFFLWQLSPFVRYDILSLSLSLLVVKDRVTHHICRQLHSLSQLFLYGLLPPASRDKKKSRVKGKREICEPPTRGLDQKWIRIYIASSSIIRNLAVGWMQ